MFASGVTHVFCASTPSPALPSFVARASETPPTETFVDARITVVPAVPDVITAVHEPDPDASVPGTVQLVGPTKLPGPDTIVKLITVPSGAFTNPAP